MIDPTRYHVVIEFSDGTYENTVTTYSPQRAYQLAVQDARMASTCKTFYGAVLKHTETPITE